MGECFDPLAALPKAQGEGELGAHEGPGFEPAPELAGEFLERFANRFAARIQSRPVQFKLAVGPFLLIPTKKGVGVRAERADGDGLLGE